MKIIRNIIISLIIFMILSLMNLYSYSFAMFQKQLLWYIVGFILIILLAKIDNKKIYKYTFILYIIFNLLLLYLLLFGESVNGSKAWLDLYFFSFQPSEFMKIILLILLSYISINEHNFLLKVFIITLIPSVLTFLEPDTGNVIFYLVIAFSILLYHGRVKKIRYLIYVGIISLIGFACLYFFNRTLFVSMFGSSLFYRIDRIINLFNDETYQLKMALIGIGSSFPLGIENLVSVPEASTDFAFTLLIMNSGIIGLLIYISVNIYFNFCLIELIKKASGVSKLIVFGFLIMKLFQEGIHILMNIGLFPITGITLPFISYGGSSLLSYFIILGIIINSYKDKVVCKVDKVGKVGMVG